MEILRSPTDDKLLRAESGEVSVDTGGNSSLILKIDCDLQQRNRIFKDGSNAVSQITEKAQNKVFLNFGTKPVVYDYEKGFFFDNGGAVKTDYPNLSFDGDFTIHARMPVTVNTGVQYMLDIRSINNNGTNYGQGLLLLINNAAAGLRMQTVTPTTSWDVNFNITNTVLSNTEYLFSAIRKNGVVGLFLNGKLLAKQAAADSVKFSDNDIVVVVGATTALTAYYQGYGKSIEIDNEYGMVDVNSFAVNDQVFNSDNIGVFTHLKRYKDDGNKKIFLSSRYLKDAVINSSNEITDIYDEISNIIVSGINNPTLTKYGIQCGNVLGVNKYLKTDTELPTLSSNDFYFGGWFKRDGQNTVDAIFGVPQMLELNYYSVTNNISFWLSDDGGVTNIKLVQYNYTPIIGEWYYVSVMRKNDILYLIFNGVLQATLVLPTAYAPNNALNVYYFGYANRVGSLFGKLDDWLISIGDSIIDPTGYAIGDKIFQPPRRRSLDSEFIQFPIP